MEPKEIRKGQHIVYGSNGICLVDDIKEMAFGNESKTYLILRPTKDPASVIYLPSDNTALLSRLRPTLTRKQAQALLKQSRTATPWVDDRKQRAILFREILQECDPEALLSLVKCLGCKRDELVATGKKLSSADREAFSAALDTVRDELCFSLGLALEELTEQLQSHLKLAL